MKYHQNVKWSHLPKSCSFSHPRNRYHLQGQPKTHLDHPAIAVTWLFFFVSIIAVTHWHYEQHVHCAVSGVLCSIRYKLCGVTENSLNLYPEVVCSIPGAGKWYNIYWKVVPYFHKLQAVKTLARGNRRTCHFISIHGFAHSEFTADIVPSYLLRYDSTLFTIIFCSRNEIG